MSLPAIDQHLNYASGLKPAPGQPSRLFLQEHRQAVRVVIAGGYSISRDGLRELLKTSAEMHVVGEAPDGETALRMVDSCRPDVLVLDLPIPGRSDKEILREIAARSLAVRVLVLASVLDRQEILAAIQLGARGVVLKSSASTQMLFEGIRRIMAGHYWIGQQDVSTLIEVLKKAPSEQNPPAPFRPYGLTPREFEIIPLVVRGYSNAEIAETLSISIQTVKHHFSHIFDKLGVYNRLELALFAINHRIVGEKRPSRSCPPNAPESASPSVQPMARTS